MNQFARIIGLLVCLCSTAASSVDIEQLSVIRSGKLLSSEAVFVVEAPQDTVVRVITDFDRLCDLNPAVISSSSAVQETGETRVTSRIRDCVSFFCRTVVLVEDVQTGKSGNLLSRVVPELSDFSDGNAIWQFTTVGESTRVHYRSQLQPKFWLPPLLGSGAFRRTFNRQITDLTFAIEALANPKQLGGAYPPENTGFDAHE